jgi:hypothetical protein
MDFVVRRLSPGADSAPNYHLLDPEGNVLVVADQSAAADLDARRQVRLARPDGRLLATIELPQVESNGPVAGTADYAIIHEYAVYAILSVHRRMIAEDAALPATYFMLEVEGERWMVLPDPDMAHCFAIYDQVPRSLFGYETHADVDLPSSTGQLCAAEGEWAYTISLDPERLRETGLLVLALAYLVDSTRQN